MLNYFNLQATPRLRILSSGRYLQINNAELGDAARYVCVASNIAGKMTREFTVTVNGECTCSKPLQLPTNTTIISTIYYHRKVGWIMKFT